MKLLGLMLFSVLFLPIGSYAANVVGMPSYQVPVSVGAYPDGTLEVTFPEVFNSGCERGDGRRIYVQLDDVHGITPTTMQQIQSVVLAAHAAGETD